MKMCQCLVRSGINTLMLNVPEKLAVVGKNIIVEAKTLDRGNIESSFVVDTVYEAVKMPIKDV